MKIRLNKNFIGKVLGRDVLKKDIKEFGGVVKWIWDLEKSLDLEEIWVWIFKFIIVVYSCLLKRKIEWLRSS